MSKTKKFFIFLRAMGWLILSFLITIIVIPLSVVLIIFGALLDFIHVHFVSDFNGWILRQNMLYLRFVTKKIRGLAKKVEEENNNKKNKQEGNKNNE